MFISSEDIAVNEQSSASSALLSKCDLLGLIGTLFPWIAGFRQRSLAQYARSAFDIEAGEVACESRDQAMSLFKRCICQAARKAGFSDNRGTAIAAEVAMAPVMQTGPHLHLLIEPDAYYTHLFSLMGLRAHGRSAYVSYAVSTVKFVERGRKGPGWLNLGGDAVNVFGLTRSQMIPYSILAPNGTYRYVLKNVDRSEIDGDITSRLRSIMPQDEFVSAALAIKRANASLWTRFFDPEIDFLQVDDEDIADLVAEHLRDETSWLSRHLFDGRKFVQNLLSHVDALADGPWRGWLKNSTDLFWGSEGGRLFSLQLSGSRLEAKGAEDFSVSYTSEALISALQSRKIIPNLLLMFIVTSILPGVRVLGGSRHTVYYPLMRYAFCRALGASAEDRDLHLAIARDKRPGIWGHRVLLASAEPFSELEALGDEGISEVLLRYGRLSLEEACGSLEGFVGDPLWADIKAGEWAKAGSVDDREWAFS